MGSKTVASSARVIANYGAELVLSTDTGEYLTATNQKKLGLVVCGDLVEFKFLAESSTAKQTPIQAPNLQGDIATGHAQVTKIEKRISTLARTDRRRQAKPIAANLTQLVAVTAPKPPFDPLLLDRYSVAAHHIGVDMTVVINKTDLLDDQSRESADTLEKIYRDIGYQVIRCSRETSQGIEQLALALKDQVSILVGQSGVGKSSLLNELLPDIETRTGALSKISGLGRHTTTVTTWFDLPTGGAIIDSAGVRQFALDHLSEIDIQAGFREISELSMQCKFNDCIHVHEPECAVQEALKQNLLSRQRYEHFLSMRQKDE